MKQFKRILLALMSAVIFFSAIALFPVSLKPLRSIGDSREDYTFFAINDAAVSAKKDIFVLDVKGIFIAKYDWSGKFIKKIGRKGQGPGDLNFPIGLDIFNEKILVFDSMNKRFFVCDLNLENFKYYPIPSVSSFAGKCSQLPNNRFMGVFTLLLKDLNRIAILDESAKIINHFFSGFPIKLDEDPRQWTDAVNGGDATKSMRRFMIGHETKPIFGLNAKRSQVIVSFELPDNPVPFYIYSTEGKLLKSFHYPLDKKYRFFDLYVKTKGPEDLDLKNYPDCYFNSRVTEPEIYKDVYLAQLTLREYKKQEVVSYRQSIIVFNSDGSYRGEAVLEEEENFLGIFDDDVALTVKYEEDNTVLRIQKLVF